MKPLKEILQGCQVIRIAGKGDVNIASLHLDSRTVVPESLFAAVKGTQTDGHRFISQAIEKGAKVILCEVFPEHLDERVIYVQVESTPLTLGAIASLFYGRPSRELKLVGITGTNGKTTTATLLYRLFEDLGYKSGLISTIRNRIHEEVVDATHTTPDPVRLNQLLRSMVDAGCSYCFMEVSSHAVDQHRIAGLHFAGGIFTNITHDHLDYHKTFDAYIKTKKKFFDGLSPDGFALINKDDRNGTVMVQNSGAEKFTYALASLADFRCRVVENTVHGLHLVMDGQEVWFHLIGRFNAYNLLCAYAAARILGKDKATVLAMLSRQKPVEGRFNYLVSLSNITAIVDYAHTPDALKNVLETINDIRQGNGQLITVVGAGGNRDTAKRPVMAQIACQHSNRVILTSDNPRFEEPEAILKEMKQGVPDEYRKNLLVIENRKEAIHTACALAVQGDYILVAGKGHESYQEIKGVRFPFDDMEVVCEQFEINQPVNKR